MKHYELIDTRCHLYLDDFDKDRDEYMKRASSEGVTRIYMPALDMNHFKAMETVEQLYPANCFAMTGVHPCYVKQDYRQQLDFVAEVLLSRKFAAIGEIGLDYYWERTYDDLQMICFREQIALAKKYDLPVVIHSRSSMAETIQVLKEEKDSLLRGIFHCFSGDYGNAMDIIDCGLELGIGGVVTYKNAGLAEVVARLPLKHIVLETDAPYLTPVPFRGKRNESSYLGYIMSKIAEVKGMGVEGVAAVTTSNAKSLFKD